MNDAHEVQGPHDEDGGPRTLRRVLVVGRSPGVLVDAVGLLRARGYAADATNQFGSVLEDYDVDDLDVLVFGGMVPPDTKQHLRDAITARNPRITFLQGLAGMAGVIAAQIDALNSSGTDVDVSYDSARRSVRLALTDTAHVTVEAFWGTSFTPPEPKSTSERVRDGDLGPGVHTVPVPEHVPSVASFVVVTVGAAVRVLTVGRMPEAVTRLAPTSAGDRRLPEVAKVTTRSDGR